MLPPSKQSKNDTEKSPRLALKRKIILTKGEERGGKGPLPRFSFTCAREIEHRWGAPSQPGNSGLPWQTEVWPETQTHLSFGRRACRSISGSIFIQAACSRPFLTPHSRAGIKASRPAAARGSAGAEPDLAPPSSPGNSLEAVWLERPCGHLP